jgi:dTDP-4-dehydrorhamnose 3,5-epimerase
MNVIPTEISGAFIVEPEPVIDGRGSFARWFDADVFEAKGLVAAFDQDSIADNVRAGTLRGMHLQQAGSPETKLVVCVRGAAFDVIVDLRDGPTFGKHICVELAAGTWRTVYVPAGCAHGYQTRQDCTTLLYRIAGRYAPRASGGVRWNDPALAIPWPLEVTAISERDRQLPLLEEYSAAALPPAESSRAEQRVR